MSRPPTHSGTTEIKEFLTSLIGNVPIGILALDIEGRCTLANARAAAIFETTPGQLVDEELADLLARWPALGDRMPPIRESGRIAFRMTEIRHGARFYNVSGHVIVSGTLLTFHDVSEDVILRESQASLVAQLESRNRELDQFAAMAAHDLQAPMRFIVATAHTIAMDLDELQRPDLSADAATLIEQGERMRELVLDLLEFCRAGQSELAFARVDAAALVAGEITLLAARGAYADTRVVVGDLPDAVPCDRLKFTQIIRNLLGNAMKFSRSSAAPRVSIGAEHDGIGNRWVFRVEDNGPGVSEEHRERIFLPFNRLDPTTEGTGIGLAITRKLIERHGGEIWIDPHLSEGSAFCFALPDNDTVNSDEQRDAA